MTTAPLKPVDVPYRRDVGDGLLVRGTQAGDAEQLEALQRIVFPTLADDERFKAHHYRKHLELFAAGQFVVEHQGRVVAATSTIRRHFDFDHPHHTFAEVIQGGWLTSHEPDGPWLYGCDLGVHPDYRSRGLARALYAARQELVWRLELLGQLTAGMISGYGAIKDRHPPEEYLELVRRGQLVDPTLSAQLALGFEIRTLLPDHLHDPASDNHSVLIVLPAERSIAGAIRPVQSSRPTMGSIRLRTEIPGPNSRALLARRGAAVAAGLAKATDIAVARAHGALVEDADGNTFIDLVGGIGMLAVGHTPPDVVAAIADQAGKLVHTCALVATYEPYVRLCELLNEITPGNFPKKTLLANSGAEAVENAVNLARRATGRPVLICFEGGYHGRTLLTLSLTSKYGLFKKGFGPFAPEIVRLPMPNLYRTPAGMTPAEYLEWSVAQLDHALVAQVDPSAVAAILIEPVQGEGGFLPVPAPFLAKIRSLCDQHGIVMVADEVQCGFGRTGKLFAIEHAGVVPDLVVTAKSLGAGMPISAVTGRADIMDSAHLGGIGGTYGGSPVACAAAIAAVETIRRPEFLAHVTRLGQVMREVMSGWQATHDLVGDVRGLGAMMLAEFVRDRDTREPAPEETLAIIRRAVQGGVLAMRAGLFSNCVRLLPPLVISEEQLREGLAVLGEAVAHVAGQRAPAASAR
ncbi:MAG: aminotransferase class III-fold pyridoxal phosphate-dependent enzyme [Gemmatimonadales bacterium]|nr:aminotransferase class III-fold pyridoxal phosphate-dependent enzyme [Gemmatimonadales bacterium]